MINDLNSGLKAKELLCGEILAQARAEGAEILRQAEAGAAEILKRAGDEAQKARRGILEAAAAEAARRKELMLAAVPIEESRLRSAKIETLLQTIRGEAGRRLLEPAGGAAERKRTLIELAAEAAGRMGEGAVALKLSPADFREHGAALASAVAKRAARPEREILVSGDQSVADGGVMAGDALGRQVWDNRISQRLERMWPELRRQIAVKTGLSDAGPAGGVK